MQSNILGQIRINDSVTLSVTGFDVSEFLSSEKVFYLSQININCTRKLRNANSIRLNV